jgi:membrane dipeptidase
MSNLNDATIIDGLVVSKFSRALFEDMAKGGVTAANCTCSVWENFSQTMANISQWNQWFREHNDLIIKILSTDDIGKAKSDGKVGIILGWQNTSAIDTDVRNLELFYDLGVRVVQLTYNTQNLVGSGCWETTDGGLSDFGRDVIDEMNRLGMLVDLSHVGPKTSDQAIKHSGRPVAYTHCCPMLLNHPRNKTDEQLRTIAKHGGFVGFASYTPFLPKGPETTIDDCIDGVNYLINLIGEDSVGLGTDWVQDQDITFFDYISADKGLGRSTTKGFNHSQVPPMPKGLETLGDYRSFIPAMEKAGWSEKRIRGVLGENWLKFLDQVW